MPPSYRWMMRMALGVRGPRQPVLGTECAGVVERVGDAVTRFHPGEAVVVFTDLAMGCHAERVAVHEGGLVVPKPGTLGFEEAAALSFGGTTALHFLERVGLKPGERVLVNGATGGVGAALVQLALHRGAHVTAVCRGANVAWVLALGAHEALDYAEQDFARGPEGYDVIFDVAGTAPYARSRGALRPGGRLALLFPRMREVAAIPWIHATSDHRVVAGTAVGLKEHLELLARLAEEGGYRPPIHAVFPFEEISQAHRAAAVGGKRGTVAVGMRPGS